MKRLSLPGPCAHCLQAARHVVPAVFLLCFSGFSFAASPQPDANPDFNRAIRPILSENCYKCHGPDEAARKGNLRFDRRAAALQPAKSGLAPIVPGAPEKSGMVARITSTDPEKRMPPISTGKKLSALQVNELKQWIRNGAVYAEHWAYVKPLRPPLPDVQNKDWAKNSIDRFILARLEKEGLKPSPEADKARLIRRVSL